MTDKTNIEWMIVTGASAGLGAAIACEIARSGSGVLALARSSRKLEDLASIISGAGGRCIPIVCDVTDSLSLDSARRSIESYGCPVSGLVNNAGTLGPIGNVLAVDPQEWARVIATNLTAAYNVIRMFTALNGEQIGTIVNISSGASQKVMEGWSAYCASKAGLAMLTRSIHLEAGPRLRCFGFQPGLVDTDMQSKIRSSGINPVSAIPQAQLLPPHEPARIVAWLLEERPEDLAGSEFRADDPAIRRRAGLDVQ